MRMYFFVFFGFIKFNFVELTRGVTKRDALALIEVEILFIFSLKIKRLKRIAGNSS
jgi:hypothetical protein